MTCKHLYQHLACHHPSNVLVKDGINYYHICYFGDLDEDKCPYYEGGKSE